MSGLTQSSLFSAVPAPPLPAPVAALTQAPAPVSAPTGLPSDQLALSAAPAPDLTALQSQLLAGTQVEATMALYELQRLASTQRAAVLPILISQLNAGGAETTVRAAIDILRQLNATEAIPALQTLQRETSQPGLRLTAQQAVDALSGRPTTPTSAIAGAPALPAPTPPRPALSPQTPLVSPTAAATATPSATPAGAIANDAEAALIARFLDPVQAPQAAVELSKLAPEARQRVANRLVRDFQLPAPAFNLLATVVAKRPREQGAVDTLQQILRKNRGDAPLAVGRAAVALLSLRDPGLMPDVLRALATRSPGLNQTKRALIDTMAKQPTLLAHPSTAAVLGAVLNANEDPGLAASASHALGLMAQPQAQQALARSPLLKALDFKQRLRALWDLGARGGPLSAEARPAVQRLASDPNAQVRAQAEALLKRGS